MFRKILVIVILLFAMIPLVASAASWSLNTWVKSAGGTISVRGGAAQTSTQGSVFKSYTTSQPFTVTVSPSAGYSVSQVNYNNVITNNPSTMSYTVQGPLAQKLYATFAPQLRSVTASASSGGSVSPTSLGSIYYGQKLSVEKKFTFSPFPSTFNVASIDGVPAGATVSHTLPAAAKTQVTVTLPVGFTFTENIALYGAFTGPPVAVIKPPQIVTSGTPVTLDGSASTGTIISYVWNQLAGPGYPATKVIADNTTGIQTAFTPTVAGTYTFSLTVTGGSTSITSVIVTNSLVDAVRNQCQSCHSGNGIGPDVFANWSSSAHKTNNVICSQCHIGTNNGGHPGTITQTVCNDCHNKSTSHNSTTGLTNSCVSCHNPHSAVASGGSCDSCHDSPPATASHLKHYGSRAGGVGYGDTRITQAFGNYTSGYVFGCGNCHPMAWSKHNNGTVDVELYNSTAPAGSIKALNTESVYVPNNSNVYTDSRGLTYTKGACSNVYCHSYNSYTTSAAIPDGDLNWESKVVKTRIYKDITWEGTALGCSGCHGNPTRTSYLTNDGGAGDSHSWMDDQGYENLHNYNHGWAPLSCSDCHNETVKKSNTYTQDGMGVRTLSEVPISNFSKHVNGSNDVAFDIHKQFDYSSYYGGAKFENLSSPKATYNPETKNCSNVSCHRGQTTVKWGTPYRWVYNECNVCHSY